MTICHSLSNKQASTAYSNMNVATWRTKGVEHGNQLFLPIWQEVDSGFPLLIVGLRVQQEERKSTGSTMAKRKGNAWEKKLQITKQDEKNVNVKLVIVFTAFNLLKASLHVRLTSSSGFRSFLNPLQARILPGIRYKLVYDSTSVIGTHVVRR